MMSWFLRWVKRKLRNAGRVVISSWFARQLTLASISVFVFFKVPALVDPVVDPVLNPLINAIKTDNSNKQVYYDVEELKDIPKNFLRLKSTIAAIMGILVAIPIWGGLELAIRVYQLSRDQNAIREQMETSKSMLLTNNRQIALVAELVPFHAHEAYTASDRQFEETVDLLFGTAPHDLLLNQGYIEYFFYRQHSAETCKRIFIIKSQDLDELLMALIQLSICANYETYVLSKKAFDYLIEVESERYLRQVFDGNPFFEKRNGNVVGAKFSKKTSNGLKDKEVPEEYLSQANSALRRIVDHSTKLGSVESSKILGMLQRQDQAS